MNIENYPTLVMNRSHDKVSDRYCFFSTKQIIEVLEERNWLPSQIYQSGTRMPENHGFQKHLIRFSNPDHQDRGDRPEIVLINSHMGNAALKLMLGYFRFVCGNGLIVGEKAADCKIRHIGYTAEGVRESLEHIVSLLPQLTSSVERFKGIELTRDEEEAYGEAAIGMAFDGEKYVVDPRDVIRSRRIEDRSCDLWTTFNRTQENLIKGGIGRRSKDGKRRRTTAVKSVDENVRLNRALWSLTEKMAELKTTAMR